MDYDSGTGAVPHDGRRSRGVGVLLPQVVAGLAVVWFFPNTLEWLGGFRSVKDAQAQRHRAGGF